MEQVQSVVLVGAGNVATHLGRALTAAGYVVRQVYSRTVKSASALAEELHCDYTTDAAAVAGDAALYIVSVKDDALSQVLPWVVRRNPSALFVHTAGSVPMDVWKGLAGRYGVLYPMQTFSRQRAVDFSTVSFFVEANTAADLALLKELSVRLGGKVYEASSEQRRYLHIAAVFACNFSNHMYAVADRLLAVHGLPFEALLPLIDETARKVHGLPPKAAQTGPAVRDDRNVMECHRAMLSSEPELAELYRTVSRSIRQLDEEEG